VALGASYGDMAAGQHKPGLLVLGEGKGRRLVSLEIVALVTSIEIGSRHKLTGVTVGMAIGAEAELDLIQRVFALGNMALLAFQAGVTALQGVIGRSVLFHGEE
jgi:hypothetical protein